MNEKVITMRANEFDSVASWLLFLADLGLSKEEAGTDFETMDKSKMIQEINIKISGYSIN